MLSVRTIISTKINGKDYEFSCAPDSPIDDILEANSQIHAFVIGRKVQQQQQAVKPEEEQPKSE